MALITEDGTGLSTAESYVSVAEASTYISAYAPAADVTTWTAATTAEKERGLRLATQYLDAFYATRWVGARVLSTQALDWPRVGGETRDGFAIDSDSVPLKLTYACAELALRVAKGDTLVPDIDEPAAIASESVNVGSIAVATSYFAGKGQLKQYTVVAGLVAGLLLPGGGSVRA